MSRLHLAVGVALIVAVVVDLLWTTLWVEGGAGPLSARFMAGSWRTLRRAAGDRPRVLTLAGPLILTLGIVTWILLLWAGWSLVFASAEGSIAGTPERESIAWTDVIYFAGYAVFTLGNGDFYPQSATWQLATVLASASGLLFVTLIVTYVLSVLGAVTQKRAFASSVSGLGPDAHTVVTASWSDDAVAGLDVPLDSATSELDTLTSNHEAYPVLHYFHSKRAEQTTAKNVAMLDDVLLLLQYGLREDARPSGVVIRSADASVEYYLRVLRGTFVTAADRSPRVPDLDPLREAGVPTVSDEEFAEAVGEIEERRRILLGHVESDAREWPTYDRT